MRDSCILGLDFLRFIGCTLNLNCRVLILPGGECIQLTSPAQQVSQIVPTNSLTACATMSSPLTHAAQPDPPNSSPDCVVLPLHQQMACLDAHQQMSLWQLLWEFNDIFALSEDEVGLTHLVQHHIDIGEARPIKVRPHHLPMVQQMRRSMLCLEQASLKPQTVPGHRLLSWSPKIKARGGVFAWTTGC